MDEDSESENRSIKRTVDSATVSPRSAAKEIVFLLFNDFSLREFSTTLDIFQTANRYAYSAFLERTCAFYDIRLVSISGGRVVSSSSAFVWTERLDRLRDIRRIDALFIAGTVCPRFLMTEAKLSEQIQLLCVQARTIIPMSDSKFLFEADGTSTLEDNLHETLWPFDGAGAVQRARELVWNDLGLPLS